MKLLYQFPNRHEMNCAVFCQEDQQAPGPYSSLGPPRIFKQQLTKQIKTTEAA